MGIEDWRSQIRRGTLEFCILLMISAAPRYGYEIMNALERWPILSARESTIYPLLRRLMKEDLLSSFWREASAGLPPRKYYAITDKGREYLSAMGRDWNDMLSAIAGIKEEQHDGKAFE